MSQLRSRLHMLEDAAHRTRVLTLISRPMFGPYHYARVLGFSLVVFRMHGFV